MADIYELSEKNRQRSLALTDIIRQAIADGGGKISFSHFMGLALYQPAFGYYTAENFTIGQSGDFTTAPAISPLFAYCFANQCQPILSTPGMNYILELGPGTGQFACDLLFKLQEMDCLPEKYYFFEISPILREKQKACLATHHPALLSRCVWLSDLPTNFQGVIIGNEVLDALSVDRFEVKNGSINECMVGWKDNQFYWQNTPAPSAMQAALADISFPAAYQSEVCLNLPAFVGKVCDSMQRGLILFADYGYGRDEYYHPERRNGTLTCFYQHKRHSDPLILPGLQDITAHVDFTRVIECASEHGADLAGFTTQAGFLLANNLLSFAEKIISTASPKDEFKLNQAIKTLTLPSEMGETIKVMALSKELPTPLPAFTLQDRRRDL